MEGPVFVVNKTKKKTMEIEIEDLVDRISRRQKRGFAARATHPFKRSGRLKASNFDLLDEA
jgi:hypothetical protein